MSLHRACCCGEACVCTGCDFATSYQAACMSWGVNWNHDPKRADPCAVGGGCTLNDEEPVIHEVQVSAQYSMRSGPITRSTDPSGACCYYRVGICDVTYAVTIVAKGACCQYPGTCTVTRTYNGAREVPYLLTVTPYCWQTTTCVWLHTVSVCPIALGVDEFLLSLDSADCMAGPLDCENLPLDRLGLYLGGNLFQWRTDYKALNTIVWPTEFIPVAKCPAGAISVNCVYGHVAANIDPFALYFVQPDVYQTPTVCPTPSSGVILPYWGATSYNCSGFSNNTADPCLGAYTIDEPCCLKEYSANANPPCYT